MTDISVDFRLSFTVSSPFLSFRLHNQILAMKHDKVVRDNSPVVYQSAFAWCDEQVQINTKSKLTDECEWILDYLILS